VGALLLAIVAAAIHGLAFYGLRGRKRWGWAAAVLVAGLWSLVLVGIPFLYVLLKRSTRRAYGLE
jgi:biotin transporter BioY